MMQPGLRLAAFAFLLGLVLWCARPAVAQSPQEETANSPSTEAVSAADLEFFEKRIRPVLAVHCFECHSARADDLKSGLRLDTREGVRKGGYNGPAVVPGDVENSFLLRAIRYEDEDYQMPPDGKLSEKVIADFEKWVTMGAPDPRAGEDTATAGESNNGGRAELWSLQAPQRASAPEVRDSEWSHGPIDQFVLARLEAAGLQPAPRASKAVLLRRVYCDLIGLPPTPEEISAFLADESPDAWERVVDRLLASPRFGERWGRHWLDVARYADSNGLDQNLTFHQAWRYRNWVIDALNADMPLDQFIVEQLAGDLLPASDDDQRARQLIATGFLALGPKMLSERDKEKLRMDVVDEQIDTTGRAFLGLTLGCARCHDHKFDPVPTADYYALAGIFRSTQTLEGIKLNNVFVSGWKERPLPIDEAHAAALEEHRQAVAALEEPLKKDREELKRLEQLAESMRRTAQLAGVVVDDTQAMLVGQWKDSTYNPTYVGKGYIHDDRTGKGEKSVTFSAKLPEPGVYEVRISYTGGNGRCTRVPVVVRHAEGTETLHVNQVEAPPINGLFKPIGRFRFDPEMAAEVTISNADTEGFHVIADAVQFVPLALLETDAEDAAAAALAEGSASSESDSSREAKELAGQIARVAGSIKEQESQLEALKKNAPPPPPVAMAIEDVSDPGPCRIHRRGDIHQLGDEVPRGFVSAVAPAVSPNIAPDQSGRLELARWIANRENPLTARVAVNRIWQHLWGEGLVRSVDNFGTQGQRPSHPELLDYLALQLTDDGWSVKAIARAIVLSRAYQSSTQADESTASAAAAADPEDRLLWRAHRRRLDAEVIRDTMLAVNGQLDLSRHESPVASLGETAVKDGDDNALDTDAATCRSVYLPIVRGELPPILQVFDFADPEMVVGRRAETTVPAQALLLLNSPFVRRCAQEAARPLAAQSQLDEAARVTRLYLQVFGRMPDEREMEWSLAYLDECRTASRDSRAASEGSELAAWTNLCHGLFASTEFRFLD